ncbi:acyltransferase [Mycetohabitans sp. B2]|uniref:acyltransferase family protein n=1 Tax=Mycetohabitans sp. B2 TaxID=2841274 RepID=UPI001F1EE84C|nr:acyltransferase [Mycetohabitans sp. B2]MCF7696033.1 acyltransferase [Mycetohabitans sp. B2]
MANPPENGRLDHIDAMRAIAVLFVIWTHYAELLAPLAGSQHGLDALQRSVNFGRIGVVIFFGISGMLIPNSLRGSIADGTRTFLIRRFMRLYPAFWLSVPLGYLTYWTLFQQKMSSIGILVNLTMIPTAFGFDTIMGHYWTLETELYFYLLCLVLFWSGLLHQMRALVTASAALGILFVLTTAWHVIPNNALGQYKGMLYHLSIMFWGAVFRKAYDEPNAILLIWPRRRSIPALSMTYRGVLIALTTLIALIAVAIAIYTLRRHDYAHVSSSIGYLVGIALFASFATLFKIHHPSFAWLGKISYSVYLLHGIPLYLVFWLCRHYQWTGAPLGVYMLAPLAPAIALSWLSFKFCEAPSIRAGHALTCACQTRLTERARPATARSQRF